MNVSQTMPRGTGTRRGFTLIELLTVIAIIGILASILIPVVGAVRESARASKCISNLRQMGTGIELYANDHGGASPPPAFWGNGPDRFPSNNLRTTFHYRIWEYVGYEVAAFDPDNNSHFNHSQTENIFHCPTTVSSLTYVPGGGGGDPYSYGMNEVPNIRYKGVVDGIRTATLDAASRTMAVMELHTWKGNPGKYFEFGLLPHKGGGNFLFYDGHVEQLKFEAVPKNASDNEGDLFWGGGL